VRVGNAAEHAGVNVETLLYHELGGLLPAPDREPAGRYRYEEATTPPTVLHVTNGESAATTLRRTALGGAVLPWQDVLHAGPVPHVPRPELLRLRAAFVSDCGWGGRRAILASLERRDRQLHRAFADRASVVLWFEHDLVDQLQLVDILALAGAAGVAPSAIVVDAFPGRPAFRGLGELTVEELETLWPARRQVGDEEVETAVAVWDAVRAPEPEALVGWAVGGTPSMPLLAPALCRLVEELPAPGDGLSTTERTALSAIAAGARTPTATFHAAQDLEPAPFLGDAWFFRALAELGRGSRRLVETQEGEELPVPPPLGDGRLFAGAPVRLTERGERVLGGEEDRVELLGVDRWVGGTHVVTGAVWRWDPHARRLLAP
jgi:hypothetical protein